MKEIQVVDLAMVLEKARSDGALLLIGEYRGSCCELVKFLDKETGKAMSFVKLTHTLEVGGPSGLRVISVSERLDRSITDPKEVTVALKKGQKVLVMDPDVATRSGQRVATCGEGKILVLK